MKKKFNSSTNELATYLFQFLNPKSFFFRLSLSIFFFLPNRRKCDWTVIWLYFYIYLFKIANNKSLNCKEERQFDEVLIGLFMLFWLFSFSSSFFVFFCCCIQLFHLFGIIMSFVFFSLVKERRVWALNSILCIFFLAEMSLLKSIKQRLFVGWVWLK